MLLTWAAVCGNVTMPCKAKCEDMLASPFTERGRRWPVSHRLFSLEGAFGLALFSYVVALDFCCEDALWFRAFFGQ